MNDDDDVMREQEGEELGDGGFYVLRVSMYIMKVKLNKSQQQCGCYFVSFLDSTYSTKTALVHLHKYTVTLTYGHIKCCTSEATVVDKIMIKSFLSIRQVKRY